MALPSNTKRKVFDGRYEIIGIVGRGTNSVVYHARHISGSAQEVALKVLVNRKDNTPLSDRLRKEALTLVSCRHKYVVRLDDFHSIDDLCYLSMEYAPLGDLAKYSAATPTKTISADQISTFLQQALEALDFVHATGVIHRDVRPENILVVNERETRLADFGLALLPGDETDTEDLKKGVGSLDYLAPEVLQGIGYDTRSDLYSLGVSFYELATGKHPFRDAPLAEQLDVRKDARMRPLENAAPQLPAHIAAVITTLCRFDILNRFATAADALQALRDPSFRAATVTQTAPDTATDTTVQSSRTSAASAPTATEGTPPPTTSITTSSATSQANFSEQPANSDVPLERSTQQPEKIDLDRIKAIFAKDTERRAIAFNQQSEPDDENTSGDMTPYSAPALQEPLRGRPRERHSSTGSPRAQSQRLRGFSLSDLRTRSPRLLTVAGAFATITIVLALILPLLSSTPKATKSPKAEGSSTQGEVTRTASEEGSNEATTGEASKATGPFVSLLQNGIYVGTIENALTPGPTPLMLVSSTQNRTVTLVLGVEGWTPSEAPTIAEDGATPESVTFRGNGFILKLKGEMSSDQITGTFTDMVSGETGSWVAKRAP